MSEVFITGIGAYLPNQAIQNHEIEDYLGRINGQTSRIKERILRQNGIVQRYFALDKNQQSTHSNAELAANAIRTAVDRTSMMLKNVSLIAAGSTQGDLPVPGFGSMVHGLLDVFKCEVASFQSVCSSGIMALKYAFTQIKATEIKNAVSVGSEFASRLFKSTRFEAQGVDRLDFDAEFLRWMLSDGAGAFALQNTPNEHGLSLKIDWIDLRSHANEFPVCMYTGKTNNKSDDPLIRNWLDYPDIGTAAQAGAINLKQDIRLLDRVIKVGISHYFDLIDQQKINSDNIDHFCCHYSSEIFKDPIFELMHKGGGHIPKEKWFSNLTTKGNTGSASIYIMLEELMYSGRLKGGDTILCMVPESGRFITSFMQLKVVEQNKQILNTATHKIEAPELHIKKTDTSDYLIRQLTKIWVDFETKLLQVPVVKKIYDGRLSLSDYKLLLLDLRQQVVDGSQWISRAASNIHIDLFELRSAFIKHTAAEHKDFLLLEKNYVALDETLDQIQSGNKNIGSAALSSFMFQQASRPNPVDLLGSMFIIEGIGKRLAGNWGRMIQNQLNLKDNQVSFLTYHGVADESHFENLERALEHPMMNRMVADDIARTAKITASLYIMQLSELGNY